jgi:uncharacterized protein YhdP
MSLLRRIVAGVLAAAMAVSPAIGLGRLFAQWVLREPLMAANTGEFHVTGGWADPQVRRVGRHAQAPAGTYAVANPSRRPPG